MPVRKSDAMAKAATVDGYVPKAARKRIEEEREKEKTHRAASITWNEPEIEKIEEELSREKREASGVDPAGGVFYFDTFGEGKKPEGDFVPSIGGISHSFDEHTSDDDIAVGALAYVGAAAGIVLQQCSAAAV